jgi:hypothetical protein
MTMLNRDTIVIETNPVAQALEEEIKSKAAYGNLYKFVRMPEGVSANVLFFNDTIAYPVQYKKFYANLDELKQIKASKELGNSEFAKVDGALTCRSVLFSNGF